MLVTKSFQEITDPAHLGQDLEGMRKLIAGEIDDYQTEKRYIRADGNFTWGELHVSLVHDGSRGVRITSSGKSSMSTPRNRQLPN